MSRHRFRVLPVAVAVAVLLSGVMIAPGPLSAGPVTAAAADDDFATAPYPDWRTPPILDSVDATADQWDIFQVYLENGEAYQFDLTGAGTGENLDLYLYYPETTDVADTEQLFDSSELAGSTESVTGTGDWDGYWYVAVKATSGGSAYTLTGTASAPNDNVPAVDLGFSPVTGALDSFSNWDEVYRVWLDAGDQLYLTLTLRPDPASPSFAPDLYVFPPTTTDVHADPASVSNLGSTFPKTLAHNAPTPGFYYIDVRDMAAGHEWGECVLDWTVVPAQADWYWQNTLPNAESLLGIDFIDGSTGWAVGSFGTIMTSADGGVSWRLLPSETSVTLNDVCFADELNGWAVGQANTILRTSDGGNTWVPQYPPGASVTLNAVKMVSATKGWIVGNEGRVLTTDNGGSSWTLQPGAGTGTLTDCDFVSDTNGWIVGAAGAVFTTSNGGSTWTPQTSNTTSGLQAVDFLDATHGWAVGVPPVAPGGQVVRTTDGGATWIPVRVTLAGSRTVNLSDVAFADALHGWATGDLWGQGYVLETVDGGATWTSPVLGEGHPLRAMDAVDASTGFAAGDAGVIWGTSDGDVWGLTRGPDRQFSISDIQFRGTLLGWAVGVDGRGLTTTDGGVSWTPVSIDVGGGTLMAVHFVDDTHGIVAGEGGHVFTTDDGGGTWTARTSGTTVFLRGAWFQSSTLAWVVGDSGTIRKSTNGGVNWVAQTSGIASTLHDVRFATDSVGWAVGNAGVILKTTDGGTNWTPQTTALPATLFSIFVLDEDHAWICGSDGVQYTSNGGTTWTRQSSLSNVEDIGFADANNGWIVGYSGLLYRTSDGGGTWIPERYTRAPLNALSVTGVTSAWVGGGGGTILATRDASPLIGTFFVDDNAAYALSTSIQLHSHVPLATDMRYRNWKPGAVGWSSWTSPMLYNPDLNVGLSAGEGEWLFEVEYTDGVRMLTLQDTIIVDTQAPTAPSVAATPLSTNSVRVSWGGATDAGSGIVAYEVYQGAAHVGTVSAATSSYTVNGLSPSTAYSFGVKAVDAVGYPSVAGTAGATTLPLVPVYRFYNVTNGTHFFTDSAAERDHVIATWPSIYTFEGEAYRTNPWNNIQPLTRLYNKVSGSHFYTSSPGEAATALAKWPNVFSLDGLTYAVNPWEVANSVPVFRFYNVRNGSHFYTASEAERNNVIAKWPDIYNYEGPAFWIGQ